LGHLLAAALCVGCAEFAPERGGTPLTMSCGSGRVRVDAIMWSKHWLNNMCQLPVPSAAGADAMTIEKQHILGVIN